MFKTEIKIISKLFQDPENGGSSLKKKKKSLNILKPAKSGIEVSFNAIVLSGCFVVTYTQVSVSMAVIL